MVQILVNGWNFFSKGARKLDENTLCRVGFLVSLGLFGSISAATTIFSDGFEAGDPTIWSISSSSSSLPQLVSSNAFSHSGVFSANGTDAFEESEQSFTAQTSEEVTLSWWLYIDDTPNAGIDIKIFDPNKKGILWYSVGGDGVNIYTTSDAEVSSSDFFVATVGVGSWHQQSITYNFDTSKAIFSLDGNPVHEVTSVISSLSSISISAASRYYIDDMLLSQTPTTTPTPEPTATPTSEPTTIEIIGLPVTTLSGQLTTAQISGEIESNGEKFKNAHKFTHSSQVDFTTYIKFDEEDLGKEVYFYMVAQWDDGFYMNTENGWKVWNRVAADLEPLKKVNATLENERNDISVPIGLSGKFGVYVGYQVVLPDENGTRELVYNASPIAFIIQENITGTWSGTISAETLDPDCTGTIVVNFIQEGNLLKGNGKIDKDFQSNTCTSGEQPYNLIGIIDGSVVFFTVYWETYRLKLSGSISDTHREIKGVYTLPGETRDTWELSKQK